MDAEKRYEVEADFLRIGRTFAEYRRMFDLDPTDLAGARILDCPGGPSSFTAVVSELGAAAVAVDPMYGPPVESLRGECVAAVDRTREQLTAKRELFVWDYYGDPDTRARYLRAAAERFLADYAHRPRRYVDASLPTLPFEDDAFDLALLGNFLFLYDDRLDRETHLASLRELARVAAEVRIFPLASLDRSRSDYVEPAVDTLEDDGLTVDRRAVPYEFQRGVSEMLVVR